MNTSPSLAREFIIDDLVKQQMVDDAIDIVNPVLFEKSKAARAQLIPRTTAKFS